MVGTTTNGVRRAEYLRMRTTIAPIVSSFSFAIVTILMSGIDMFAFAVVFRTMLAGLFTSVSSCQWHRLIFVFGAGWLPRL
jgi:hypothetical protein